MVTHYVRYIVKTNEVTKVAFPDAAKDTTHGAVCAAHSLTRLAALEAVNHWNEQAYGRYIYWIE